MSRWWTTILVLGLGLWASSAVAQSAPAAPAPAPAPVAPQAAPPAFQVPATPAPQAGPVVAAPGPVYPMPAPAAFPPISAPSLAPTFRPGPAAPMPQLEAPPTGLGMLIAGSVLSTVGGAFLVTMPWCTTRSHEGVCLGASAGIGGGLLAVGVPLLAVGGLRFKAFEAWSLSPTRQGAALSWRTSW